MPRQIRMEYPGAVYHVLSRGDRKGPIFLDDGDGHDFIKTLAEACQKTGFEIHGYCLMKNHFHLVVETPEGNLVAGMRWLMSTYANRFNHRHELCGHVFSGRYKALVVEANGSGYLRTVCDYTHLNPVRAKVLSGRSRLLEYPWSSFGGYLTEPRHRAKWLRVDRLLGEHGIAQDTAEGRREFERRMEKAAGGRRRSQSMEGDAAWVVCGKPAIQAGIAGTVARKTGARPCRADTAGGGRGARGGDHRQRTEAVGMERGRVEPAGQKRSGQSGVGGPIARGDDPDHRADRAEVAPGNPEHFEHKSSREKRHE